MKALLGFFLTILIAHGADGIAGRWTGTMSLVGPSGETYDGVLTLILEPPTGTEFTGTLASQGKEPVAISSGVIKGDKISFALLDTNPSVEFNGTIDGDQMQFDVKGKVRIEDEEHQFTGKLTVNRSVSQ